MQRRRLLRMAGATQGLALPELAAADPLRQKQDEGACSLPACIHPTAGYTGGSQDDILALPTDDHPDHQVELLTRPRGEDGSNDAAEDGDRQVPDRYFEPTGLAVAAGDVVMFALCSPGHTVTAYHPQLGRQRRVPEGVPPVSSPVLGVGDVWLYRFEIPGVYDLFSAPHELFGAAMRIVVDDVELHVGPTDRDRRPPQLTAGLVLEDDAMAPGTIVERGAVGWDDLADASKQRLVSFRDPLAHLVERFEGDDTDATAPFDLEAGLTVTVYDHDGSGRFVAELVPTGGERRSWQLVNDFDAVAGVTAFGVEGGDYVLDVEAGGPWTVAIAQPRSSEAGADALPVSVEGDGPGYVGPFLFEGLVRATGRHDGSGTFLVEAYDERGRRFDGVVFNEDGSFRGISTVTFDGIGWLTVDADGEWSIELEHVG